MSLWVFEAHQCAPWPHKTTSWGKTFIIVATVWTELLTLQTHKYRVWPTFYMPCLCHVSWCFCTLRHCVLCVRVYVESACVHVWLACTCMFTFAYQSLLIHIFVMVYLACCLWCVHACCVCVCVYFWLLVFESCSRWYGVFGKNEWRWKVVGRQSLLENTPMEFVSDLNLFWGGEDNVICGSRMALLVVAMATVCSMCLVCAAVIVRLRCLFVVVKQCKNLCW